jgi:hypothetical protein
MLRFFRVELSLQFKCLSCIVIPSLFRKFSVTERLQQTSGDPRRIKEEEETKEDTSGIARLSGFSQECTYLRRDVVYAGRQDATLG